MSLASSLAMQAYILRLTQCELALLANVLIILVEFVNQA